MGKAVRRWVWLGNIQPLGDRNDPGTQLWSEWLIQRGAVPGKKIGSGQLYALVEGYDQPAGCNIFRRHRQLGKDKPPSIDCGIYRGTGQRERHFTGRTTPVSGRLHLRYR